MKRRVLLVLVCISVVLASAEVAGWVRGYVRHGWFVVDPKGGGNSFTIRSDRGLLSIHTFSRGRSVLDFLGGMRGPLSCTYVQGDQFYPPDETWYGFGLSYGDDSDAPGGPAATFCTVVLPYWFLVAITLLAPFALWMLWSLIGRRRRLRGLCGRCGYDLRATPGRCPECGTIPALAASKLGIPGESGTPLAR